MHCRVPWPRQFCRASLPAKIHKTWRKRKRGEEIARIANADIGSFQDAIESAKRITRMHDAVEQHKLERARAQEEINRLDTWIKAEERFVHAPRDGTQPNDHFGASASAARRKRKRWFPA